MKALALSPTEENVINTIVDDKVGRIEDVCSFVLLLSSLENTCSIGIDGKWGTGKTFFVKQAKLFIDSLNPNTPELECSGMISNIFKNMMPDRADNYPPIITAYYDAWQHDNEDDPLLSLVYEIMKENYNNSSIDNIKSWTDILGSIANVLSDRNISELVKCLKGEDIFKKQKKNEEIYCLINGFLSSLLPEKGNKLVVFVDELDRCSPIYAVKLLERIKHFFSCENILFVFSVNFNELQKTIRKYYGEQFDSCRYLDRFFDLRIDIPPIDIRKYVESIGHSFNSNARECVCAEIIKQMDMGMREISRFLQMSKYAAYKYTDEEHANRQWSRDDGASSFLSFCVIVPIAIALKMTDSQAYDDFVDGRDSNWLERIVLTGKLGDWITSYLISSSESYSGEEGKQRVTRVQKLRDVYNAIFVKSYDDPGEYETQIGNGIFNRSTKVKILKAISFVSPYTSLE